MALIQNQTFPVPTGCNYKNVHASYVGVLRYSAARKHRGLPVVFTLQFGGVFCIGTRAELHVTIVFRVCPANSVPITTGTG